MSDMAWLATGRYVAIWSVRGPVAMLRPGPCVDRSHRCDLIRVVRSQRCDLIRVDRSQHCDLVRVWTGRNVATWSMCGPVATFRPGSCSVRSLCVDRFGYLSDVLGQLVFGGSFEAF
ncbi:hypothetical protein DY000_02030561 [Brassica cretica]|uniref:Anaphase-promoting complex subunit 4 WD40 domain-containing protein n=1 Tax=Brassica cretica TaxID=69181 RepID=A0ABQ7DM30_BRACR|nr:hypothetical protein DY000_02030561 [Brassica cretica]